MKIKSNKKSIFLLFALVFSNPLLFTFYANAQNPYINEKTVNGITIFEEQGDMVKTGLKNKEGKIILKPRKLLVIHHIGHGYTLLRDINSKKKIYTYTVLDPKGKVVCGPTIEPNNGYDIGNSIALGSCYFVKGIITWFPENNNSQDFKLGLMDSLGNKLCPAIYGEINLSFANLTDLIMVRQPIFEGGLYGYVNFKGEEVIKPMFKQATRFSDDSKYALVKNKQWHVIDRTNKVIYTPKYNLVLNENNKVDCGGVYCYDKGAMRENGYFVMLDSLNGRHLLNINGIDKPINLMEYDDFILGKAGADFKRKIEAEVEANAKAYAQNQANAPGKGIYLLYYVARFQTNLSSMDYYGSPDVSSGIHCQSVCVQVPHGSDAKTIAKKVWGEEKLFQNEKLNSREYVLQPCSSQGDCDAKAKLLDSYKKTVHVNNSSYKGSDLILGSHTHDYQLKIIE